MVTRKSPGLSKPMSSTRTSSQGACYRCGAHSHQAAQCRFKDVTCHKCHKKGHLAKVCRSGKKPSHTSHPRSNQTHHLDASQDESEFPPLEDMSLFHVGSKAERPIHVPVTLDGQRVDMELDTGAAVSIMSEEQQQKLFPKASVQPTNVVLRTYTTERMEVLGELLVKVSYEGQTHKLPLIIVQGKGPALLGRKWLANLKLNWKMIAFTAKGTVLKPPLQEVLERHKAVFSSELGTFTLAKAHLTVQEGAQPVFHRPHPIPFAIREAVERELESLVQAGILEKVAHSAWAAPIVPVPKKDGRFRICGDYKVTVNPMLEVDQHPLPKPEELFTTLAGGQKFTKLDLSHAYQQVFLDDESKPLVTINTHLGLYRYTRLPFGVAAAPAIFQRQMDALLQGIPKVVCYINDKLITGKNEEEHLQTLSTVLERLQSSGLRVKKEKCGFMMDSVDYLGHRIDSAGLHAMPDKLEAISKAPSPTNVQELRSFLGLLNYYRKFIPNLATLLAPLNALLCQESSWKWSAACQTAFEDAKSALLSSTVLAHYDVTLPLKLAADASAYGIGAVISHVYPDGSERPIAFASRTLTSSEKNYAQLEKEALSLIFGVRKFHQYLYGRTFTLITDHRPLTTILGPKNGIPPLAAARLQRWAIILSTYSYEIQFKPTDDHANADALSRLPLPHRVTSELAEISCFIVGQIESLPVTAERLVTYTRQDPLLSKVVQFTRLGWPQVVPEEAKPFWTRREELSVENDCLVWGICVVIPKVLRGRVQQQLHAEHCGITRMKSLARSHFWWPGVDKDIETIAQSCNACKAVKNAPAVAPLHPWIWPGKPWRRIHVDFAGPMYNRMFLIVVDAHSKWPEVIEMTSTTAEKTVEALRGLFASFGLLEQLVSDNGPQFTSDVFQEFCKLNGIKYVRCSPYHPSSNWLAERFVRTFKEAMRVGTQDGRPFQQRLCNFLLSYRSTPHATTNESPSNLFLGRPVRTKFDLMKPDSERRVRDKQANQKSHHDAHSRERDISVGATVLAKDFLHKGPWLPGKVLERIGPCSYLIQLEDGRQWRRHIDHLKLLDSAVSDEMTTYPTSLPTESSTPTATASLDTTPVPEPRYPRRVRKPVQRYEQ